MNLHQLVNQKLCGVMFYACRPVHAAWAEKSTPDICSQYVFLSLENDRLLRVSPVEVTLSKDSYPSLGLNLSEISRENLKLDWKNSSVSEPVHLDNPLINFPQKILSVTAFDPLGEGTESGYQLTLANSIKVIVRHIMPPMMLGLEIHAAQNTIQGV